MKTIQIDENLFMLICRYFLTDEGCNTKAEQEITDGLNKKLDKIAIRTYYQDYLNASEAEKSEKLKKYLQEKGC